MIRVFQYPSFNSPSVVCKHQLYMPVKLGLAADEANGRSMMAGPAMVLESSTMVVLDVEETTA